MAKVTHVKAAQKDIYRHGKTVKSTKTKSGETVDRSQPEDKDDVLLVKRGEPYYHWQFAYGAKNISLTSPKRQQLTQSAFWSSLWDIEDQINEISATSYDDFKTEVESIIESLENLRDEQEEKKSNMPESLQESSTGELLQNRYDSLEEMIDELNSVDCEDFEEDSEDVQSRFETWLQEKKEELSGISYNGE